MLSLSRSGVISFTVVTSMPKVLPYAVDEITYGFKELLEFLVSVAKFCHFHRVV